MSHLNQICWQEYREVGQMKMDGCDRVDSNQDKNNNSWLASSKTAQKQHSLPIAKARTE